MKVATAHDEVEAGVWRDALEQEGIAVYLKNVDPMGSFGVASSPPFSLELFVLARDQRRARWILGRLEQGSH
ncbi:MAG: putative signal transducing protein [Dehalococcoidia bacterium]